MANNPTAAVTVVQRQRPGTCAPLRDDSSPPGKGRIAREVLNSTSFLQDPARVANHRVAHMASHRSRSRGLPLIVSLVVMGLALGTAAAPKRPPKPPPQQDSFTDHLLFYDTARWLKADGWKNGSPFDNAWLADRIAFAHRQMVIRLDDEADLGEPYSSGS